MCTEGTERTERAGWSYARAGAPPAVEVTPAVERASRSHARLEQATHGLTRAHGTRYKGDHEC
jgi:hypothetical protein